MLEYLVESPTLRDDLPDIVQVFAKKEGTESIGIINKCNTDAESYKAN